MARVKQVTERTDGNEMRQVGRGGQTVCRLCKGGGVHSEGCGSHWKVLNKLVF